MAALKDFFDAARVTLLADQLAGAWPELAREAFIEDAIDGLDALELKPRAAHIAAAMARALPDDFARAIAIVLASLGEPLGDREAWGMEVFHYLPHTLYVAAVGATPERFELAMAAQQELTQRFSAEFSIRAFWTLDRDRTIAWMLRWREHPDHNVRRLVSEGTRPRLPWGEQLRDLIDDPSPALALIEPLRDDPSLMVRRSVANHLNDVSKDHPQVVLAICARWLSETDDEARRWLVSHALRTLIKRGDVDAIALLGFAGDAPLTLSLTCSPEVVRLGGKVKLALTVSNDTAQAQRALIDLVVHLVKASGQTSPKTFKLSQVALEPGESITLRKTLSFAYHSTRTPYAGAHRLDALINGHAHPLTTLEVLPA